MQSILDGLKGAYEKAKQAVQGPAQEAVDSTGLSDVNVQAAPESPGITSTGGKRGGRRTRRSKKSKKTHRRRKH